MQIFNLQIFGSDKKNFLKLTDKQKKAWILKNTNQKNETLIDDFIVKIPLNLEVKEAECLTCKKKKNGSNISKRNVKEVADSVEPTVAKRKGKADDISG